MLSYSTYWWLWLCDKAKVAKQLFFRLFCKHKGTLFCDEEVTQTLLMDEVFLVQCPKCGKKWKRTAYEIISIPFEEW